jgi:hypothetical protein
MQQRRISMRAMPCDASKGTERMHRESRQTVPKVTHMQRPPHALVVFDDIRVMNMVATWRRIARPKLDLTSFGHWSGTGLIDWNA